MVSTATVTMTFTDFTITNVGGCLDLVMYYEASMTATGGQIPSFITFTRLTKTFTVYTISAADVGVYDITVTGYANDRVKASY
jgi:hypothetical protein